MMKTGQPLGATVFERIWSGDIPEKFIFRSEDHGIMAFSSNRPRLPFEVVVAPSTGFPGKFARFSDLDRRTKRSLHETADAVEEKIVEYCDDPQRVITHTEGFDTPDHPHIVLCAGDRGTGERLYTGDSLGSTVADQTIELITFEPQEAELLEARLDEIAELNGY